MSVNRFTCIPTDFKISVVSPMKPCNMEALQISKACINQAHLARESCPLWDTDPIEMLLSHAFNMSVDLDSLR